MTITDSAETSRATTSTWWEDFYARVDVFDPTLVDELLTEDTRFTMANHETTVGREAFRAGVANLQKLVSRMKHTFSLVIEDGDNAVLEAICEYTKHDGTVVAIPVLTAIERRDGLVAAQRIYIDLSPLFAPTDH
jgi:ketosteroid isomerase-like protein